ncbi:(2Fe-2S)-binding protein [Ornithinibacillus sp. L9]|uniref:(2Fe-2S)-binding protein n=1 Tax=Ornithinibacillus caprae TaxID=2678566 RepID=A0A6N8FDM6_9BACI|nr:2Fe-2S iron-sulfur cluster-binding protein [Ornithinibacillus caprae]MUK87505.1 (2Fe-2S)-binding protein [Ornithinibacillus caprae]
MKVFMFEGKEIPFREGQTIAGALFQAGIYGISLSKRTKSQVGSFCMTGDCCSCYVNVQNERVLACQTPPKEGMLVMRGELFGI